MAGGYPAWVKRTAKLQPSFGALWSFSYVGLLAPTAKVKTLLSPGFQVTLGVVASLLSWVNVMAAMPVWLTYWLPSAPGTTRGRSPQKGPAGAAAVSGN